MKIDGGISFDPDGHRRGGPAAEDDRLRRGVVGRDGARPVPAAAAGGRAHRAHRAGHRHRRGLRPQPDEPGRPGQRPADAARRAGSCSASARRSSRTSPSATRCRGRTRPPACASSSWPCGPSGRLGTTGTKLAFRGDFYTHTLMTPFFNPGPNPYGTPPDLPGRRGRAHDRGGRRGGRRAAGPRLHHRALHARGDACPPSSAALAKAGRTRADFEVSYPGFVVTGDRRGRDGGGRAGGQGPDRLLRLDPGLPAGARPARLGRPPARAQHPVQAGRVGGRWAS